MKKIIFDKEKEDRPYAAVNSVIFKNINGKQYLLLGKRKNVSGHNRFYLPGGYIKTGEKIYSALIREVKEKTGLDIIPRKFLWIEENFEGVHQITFYYQAQLKDKNQKPKNLEPQKGYVWDFYPIDNLPKPLWVGLKNFLEEHQQRKRVLRFATPSVDYIGVGVAAIILNKKNEVLFQLRGPKAKNEHGLWKLPGGTIEYNEKEEEALKRELKEELGIEVRIIKQVFCLDNILKKENQHWLVPFYLCRIKKGKPKILEPEKAIKIAWFSPKNLPKNLAFGTKEALKKVFK